MVEQGTNRRKRPSHYRKAEIDSISNPHAHTQNASINKYIVQGSLLNPLLDIIIGIFDCPMFVLHKMRHITKLSVCMTVISGFLLFGDTKKYTSRLQDHR